MGREMGGRFKREGIYVYLWLIHVEVWQKTTNSVKQSSFNKKKKIEKKLQKTCFFMGKRAYTRLSSLLTCLQAQRPPKTTHSPNDSWIRLTELTKSYYTHCCGSIQLRVSLVVQTVKNLPARQETWVWILGQEDLLEKGMVTHSSILAWRIPWTEESGRLQSIHHKNWTQLSD